MPSLPDSGALLTLWRSLAPQITPLLVYQISVSVFVGFSLVNAVADWFTFRRPQPSTNDGPFPSLSVLIPARDEEAVIEACVRSLLAQTYPAPLEILVLDDRSTDKTGVMVQGLASADNRVKLLYGGELAPGWKGKPNALRQLAQAATGEMLLLTDADCFFYSNALANAVRHREKVGADCLSLMPDLTCRSFWEHVVIPLQYMLVFATLPVHNVYAHKNPAFAAANGAFLLLPAATYHELGGHEAVKGEMAEDIKFAQHVKRCGKRMVYGDGTQTYSVRMYDSLSGIWHGFSKNLFPAMGKSLPVLIVWSLFLLTTQVLPFVYFAIALATGDRSLALFWFPLAHILVSLSIRFALSLRMRQAVWATFTQPLGWLITIAIGANSAYLALSGRGHTWKGRVYNT